MDLISLEQVSQRFYETIRSMVWPKVSRIGWSNGCLIWEFMDRSKKLQPFGDPNKLVAILKRVGSHVPAFEFNSVKDTQQVLEILEEERNRKKIVQYEYSLPSMFSLLNPSCVVELILEGTPIQGKELILIANTFTQLRKLVLSCGSLLCMHDGFAATDAWCFVCCRGQ
ncbi:hypothetical protein DdX_18180 [Ditylenchus destructor]|uniref:Uncharacterized protein n=1 Tax=Ditylenchus destructor TaxID=166010 RepID=A0AAD4ML92_9BILA|nr:hypothetical protein DdX_18180 [Ditylenchus destructor]